METVSFTLKVRMLTAEVMESLLYERVTWALSRMHLTTL